MERIYLTKDEKKVLQILFHFSKDVAIEKLHYERFQRTLFNLRLKGFIEYSTDERDLVKRIVLLPYAYDYLYANPKLKNPINWAKIAAFGTIITAIATILTLFIK